MLLFIAQCLSTIKSPQGKHQKFLTPHRIRQGHPTRMAPNRSRAHLLYQLRIFGAIQMTFLVNALTMRIHISAFGLQNLRHPRIAPSRAPILLRHLLGPHRHILRLALRLMSPHAREMLWRLGLYYPQVPGNHGMMSMIRFKKIWCARIDHNCVGSDGLSVASELFLLLGLAFYYIMIPLDVLY